LRRRQPDAALTLVITGIDWRGGLARYEVRDPDGKQVSSGVQAIHVSDRMPLTLLPNRPPVAINRNAED